MTLAIWAFILVLLGLHLLTRLKVEDLEEEMEQLGSEVERLEKLAADKDKRG